MSLLDDMLAIQDRKTLNIVMGFLDFRAKLQILAPVAFVKKKSDDWFVRLQDLINHIDNELRPERNRMVHDFWNTDSAGNASRMQLVARVVKDQRDRVLRLANVKPVTVEEITLLCLQVATASGGMDVLRDEYGGPSTWPQIPDSPPLPENPSPDQKP